MPTQDARSLEIEEGAGAAKVSTYRSVKTSPRRRMEDEKGMTMKSTSDEDRSEGSDSERNRNGVSRTHISLVGLGAAVGILLGFIGGRASSSAAHMESMGTDLSQLYLFHSHEDRQRQRAVEMNVSTGMYLTTFTTQLNLINVSRTGDGWAPWQLAVEGDADDRGEFCDNDDPNIKCKNKMKNPEWVKFPGEVWGLHIDPELELQALEGYEDEELIETRFQVTLTNRLFEPTLMHFHGLVPPNNLDGIPYISANPIQPNHTVFYDFIVYHRGFYWMHSHFSDHAGSGLFAPIVIRDHPTFRASLGHPMDVLMIIMDGHWRALCAYARHLYPEGCPIGGFDGWKQYSFHVNGRSLQGDDNTRGANEVVVPAGKNVRLRVLDAGTMAFYRVSLGGLEGEVLAKDGRRVKRGNFTKDFPLTSAQRVDVLLEIPDEGGCFPMIATRVTIGPGLQPDATEQGALILKTEGNACEVPQALAKKNTAKQLNFQSWMNMTGSLIAQSSIPDPMREPDVAYTVRLTGKYDFITGEARPGFTMDERELHLWPTRVWCHIPDQCQVKADSHPEETVLGGAKFCQGASILTNVLCNEYAHYQPVCDKEKINDYGRCHPPVGPFWVNKTKWERMSVDEWSDKKVHVNDCNEWHIRPAQYKYNPAPLEVCHGDRVHLTYVNSKEDKEGDGHPIHLHGTHQQLVKVNGEWNIGPLQDTWFMVKGTNITVAFDALNPGEWLLHCHIEHHLVNGMGTTLRYVMDNRCKKKLDEQKKSNWQHTPRVQNKEWPRDWNRLWEKKRPTESDFFAGSKHCGGKGCE